MINSVRNTVLSILNKNNYGYISPSDFNLYATQAQMELYEDYFRVYNRSINMENQRVSGTDYANTSQPVAEALEFFIVEKFLFPVSDGSGELINQFFAPSLVTTGDESYLINKIICYTLVLSSGTSNSSIGVPYQLVATPPGSFISDGINPGDIVINLTNSTSAIVNAVISQTQLSISEDIFTSPSQDYIVYSSSRYAEAEKVSNGKVSLLNSSLLTAPSLMFPAYTLSDSKISCYPSSLKGYGAIKATYFRYPRAPKWTYVTLLNGEPSFDQSQPDYQDFEMPQEDEYKLITKILQYCGMSIREIQVAQFAIAQEQGQQASYN